MGRSKSKISYEGLRFHFVGNFNPHISRLKPYIHAFGGKIMVQLSDKVDYIVMGDGAKINKKQLEKCPNAKMISYDYFCKNFDSGNCLL
jgi:NAD-dependent DNA ligase